jgi:hypothetical protein
MFEICILDGVLERDHQSTINQLVPARSKRLLFMLLFFSYGRPGFLGMVIFFISIGFFSGVEENCIPKPIDTIMKITKVTGFMRPPFRKLIIPVTATMIPRAIRI